jgi:hypothetical protein
MSSGMSSKGVPLENIFDPFMPGTVQAAATGINGGGAELSTQFAKLSYGSAAPVTGIDAPLGDLNVYYAAKGTAVYTLAINGTSYTDGVGRSTAILNFNITDAGTYSITNHFGTVLASGTWLPAGQAVSQWQYNYTQTGFTNGTDPGGGNDSYTGDSLTPATIVGTKTFQVTASAAVFQSASNAGQVTLHLTKTGGGAIVTTISFDCEAAG